MKQAHRDLIAAIAEHLPKWESVTEEREHAHSQDERFTAHLSGPAGAKVTFSRAHWNQPERLRPCGHSPSNTRRGHGLPSITFSALRDPAAIAKDLNARYLAAYLDWYLPALKEHQARNVRDQEGAVLFERVRATFPESQGWGNYSSQLAGIQGHRIRIGARYSPFSLDLVVGQGPYAGSIGIETSISGPAAEPFLQCLAACLKTFNLTTTKTKS